MDRQFNLETDDMHMDASVFEDSIFYRDETPTKRRSKRVKRKWREIEALKADKALAKELEAYEFNYDLDDDQE